MADGLKTRPPPAGAWEKWFRSVPDSATRPGARIVEPDDFRAEL
jgi:hypothetical protein